MVKPRPGKRLLRRNIEDRCRALEKTSGDGMPAARRTTLSVQ
jgi:hypothetical protein